MTTPAYQRERRRLAEALKALRAGAGLSQPRLAAMLGWQQSKVSKIETRKQLPDEDDITAWVDRTGATPEDAGELLTLLRSARVESVTWKDAFRETGADGVEADLGELEDQSARIAEFQPAVISGLVQTADYTHELLHSASGPASFGATEAEIDRKVANRMERQRVLYRQDKHVQVVMLEAALRTRLVSAPAMAGQLDRLLAVGGLPALEFGIIPFTASVPVFPFGFRLYDDLVIIETIERELQLAEADQVARYEKYLELLREAAVTGEEARRLIATAAEALRG